MNDNTKRMIKSNTIVDKLFFIKSIGGNKCPILRTNITIAHKFTFPIIFSMTTIENGVYVKKLVGIIKGVPILLI